MSMSTAELQSSSDTHMLSQHPAQHGSSDLKRKRSPSHEALHSASAAPLQKAAKTHNHLQINYLARHCNDDLPLISNNDTLPNILSLLSDYQGVLDRHESMACNLGARPLGPILIKRFERLFDGPPRVLKTHCKDGTTITWLDVVEFARNKPEQFTLGQMSEGVRVCQFYTKQSRVQISEEDFVLISSGIPQKMIPPQPIIEDEEKELGTLEILERNLGQICQLADQVAARTRQLNHRLKGRKQAIMDRRSAAGPAPPVRPSSPSNVALMNGANPHLPNLPPTSQSTSGGFVAVNARPHHDQNGSGASSNTRHELLAKFHTMTDRRPSQPANDATSARRQSMGTHGISHSSHPSKPVPNLPKVPQKPAELGPSNLPRPPPISESELQNMMNSPVPIPNTPSNLLHVGSHRNNQPHEKDYGGPFKVEMVNRMESLSKGERILPPCDRCRRLHMDCLKNLTACMGCTKKHAKCSWKEVQESELCGIFSHPPIGISGGIHSEGEDHDGGERASTGSPSVVLSPPRPGMTPANNGHQQSLPHLPPAAPPPQHQSQPPHQQHGAPNDSRVPSARNSSPNIDRDRDRERNVEAQLQEAAKSGLAHANARLGAPEGKGAEYQTLVA